MKVTAKPLPPVELSELRQVGKPLRQVDALGKAVGHTVYGGDFTMPNMLHAKVFRSSQPSARIKRLDVSKARALPGVVCVYQGTWYRPGADGVDEGGCANVLTAHRESPTGGYATHSTQVEVRRSVR